MKVVSIDPGESTGYAVWEDGKLLSAGTAGLWDFVWSLACCAGLDHPVNAVTDEHLLDALGGWDELVIEDWQLYPWELQNLAWDKCRTARGIGALEFIARASGRRYTLQPAAIKDTAVRSGAEELFLRPLHENRHANDAIMHGVVYLDLVYLDTPEGAA